MAEHLMRHIVEQAGLGAEFVIDSAAISQEEIGNDIYPLAKRTLEKHGIHNAHHVARQICPSDYDYYDHIVLMDDENLFGLRRIIPNDPQGKISLLLDHTDPSDKKHHNRDVADPWYTRDFDQCWDDINVGCHALKKELINI